MHFNSKRIYFLFSLLSLSHGSSFYFLTGYFKPFYLFGPVLIFLSIFFWNNLTRYQFYIKAIILFFLFYVSSFILLGYDHIQYVDNFYMFGINVVFVMSLISLESKNVVFIRNVLMVTILFFSILTAFELFSTYRFVSRDNEILVSSLFNNPNDLASYIVVIFIMSFYFCHLANSNGWCYIFIFISSFFVVLVTMSRTALAIYIVVAAILFSTKVKFSLLLLLIVTFCVSLFVIFYLEDMLLSLQNSFNPLISENSKRLWLFLYALDADNSVVAREEIYHYFISNFDFLSLGYGIKNYSDFFSSSAVIELAKINPHSLLIDLSLSFGFLGFLFFFIPIVMLFVHAMNKRVRKERVLHFSIISVLLSYVFISFIPSSMFRLPIFFFPVIFFVLHAHQYLQSIKASSKAVINS